MKKFITALVLGCILMVGLTGCPSLDKKATLTNMKMTEKTTRENDAFWEAADVADSLKEAAKLRNQQHRDLAEEMARETGNDEEDIEAAKLD